MGMFSVTNVFIIPSSFSVIFLLWTCPTSAVQVTSIRVVNGTNISQRVGRIEIQTNNDSVYGSICDDGWDNNDAIVACRMMGYTNGGVAVNDVRFGTGSYNFLMDDTQCTGDEQTLSECLSSQTSDCHRDTDFEAGVICNENLGPGQPTPAPATTTTPKSGIISGNCQQTPTVRLFIKDGVSGTGFVQVQMPNGTWGFVCDDGWNSVAARIVCEQLCYPTNYTAKPGVPSESMLRPTNPNIALDDVNCAGTERTLQECSYKQWGDQDCLSTGGELAGVQCVPAQYLPPPAPVPVLQCGQGVMIAQFSRSLDPKLEAKHLSVLNQPSCTDASTSSNPQFVTITIPVDKCGTNVSRNGTHIIYYNEIKYDYTSLEATGNQSPITRVNSYRVIITCVLPVGVEVTERIEPVTQSVTQSAVGVFTANMTVYRSDSFDNPVNETPVQIPLGEWLNYAVNMETYDPNLKLVVTDCIATPTGDVLGTVRRVLLANKCINEETLSVYPLSNFRMGFRFKPFKFIGFDLLYIQCNATICLANDNTRECDRTCQNSKPNITTTTGRRRRSINVYHASMYSQAIIIYDPYAARQGNDDDFNLVIGNDHPTKKPENSQNPGKTEPSNPQQQEMTTSNQQEKTTSHPQQQEKTSSNPQQQGKETNVNTQNQASNFEPDGMKTGDSGSQITFIHSCLLLFVMLSISILFGV